MSSRTTERNGRKYGIFCAKLKWTSEIYGHKSEKLLTEVVEVAAQKKTQERISGAFHFFSRFHLWREKQTAAGFPVKKKSNTTPTPTEVDPTNLQEKPTANYQQPTTWG
jgi:hypothetical protein